MSRNQRTEEGAGSPGGARPNALVRVAAVSTAVLLLGSAFQASFASSNGHSGIAQDAYPPPGGGGGDGDGGGLSGGEVAAIAVGGAGLIAAGVLYANHKRKKSKSAPQAAAPPLPEGARGFSGVRLTPGDADVAAGERQVVDLEVRWKQDGKWYSVTDRPEASIRLVKQDPALIPMDGSKNAFCVPANLPAGADGRNAVLVGTFAPAGEAPLSAQARISIHRAEQDVSSLVSQAN